MNPENTDRVRMANITANITMMNRIIMNIIMNRIMDTMKTAAVTIPTIILIHTITPAIILTITPTIILTIIPITMTPTRADMTSP
ncbi:hypothetical protein [Methanimicrococcus hacksteinii]|uniref:hypothetical protein n=1 Tax=Methanimicrococcus hacksteinii TaxID=3028293 RepID=UPI00298F0D86|nr:hypothetical protein [Methanimicrococcus sp. At1]